jgi:nicotinamide mononucleotide transporter
MAYGATEHLVLAVGIVSCVAFAILFWQIKLYIDMGLQFFFIVVSLQAWYLWLHGGRITAGCR